MAYFSSPAGFGIATENDAPRAAKAHVLAKAFLAVDMKCAHCHDAPFHPFFQEDLFGVAGVLTRRDVLRLVARGTLTTEEAWRRRVGMAGHDRGAS